MVNLKIGIQSFYLVVHKSDIIEKCNIDGGI